MFIYFLDVIHNPCESLSSSFVGMLEVIAGIPFKNGVDTLCRQQFLLLANAVANLCHYGVLRLLFLITLKVR